MQFNQFYKKYEKLKAKAMLLAMLLNRQSKKLQITVALRIKGKSKKS